MLDMSLVEISSIGKDMITAVAAGVGIFVALAGLDAWKKQLKGRTNYDLARRYLRAAFKVREAVREVRMPFIPAHEFTVALKEMAEENGVETISNPAKNLQDQAVYHRRWKSINAALSEFDLETLEAEVLWGKSATEVRKPLTDCTRELFAQITLHLRERGSEAVDEVLYDTGENNVFTIKVNEAIENIEAYIQPYLR